MPVYEYRCLDCGHEFDAIQKMSAAPLETCGHRCGRADGHGEGRVERKFSVTNVGRSAGASMAADAPPAQCQRCDAPKGSCAYN